MYTSSQGKWFIYLTLPLPPSSYTPACKKDDTQALLPGVQGEFMPSEELIKYFERCRGGGGGRKYDSIPWVYGPSEDRASVSVWVLFWYEHSVHNSDQYPVERAQSF